jgi:hypothetical protein
MDVEELVTVYSLKDPNKAEIIKMALQNEGITCFLDGENQAGLTGVLEIGVMVRSWDADRALRVIKSHES